MRYRVINGPPFYRTKRGDTFFGDLTPEQERRHVDAGRIVRVIPKRGKQGPPKAPSGATRSTQPPAGGQ